MNQKSIFKRNGRKVLCKERYEIELEIEFEVEAEVENELEIENLKSSRR